MNCTRDLKKVATHLPAVLNRGGFVTWVVMPPVCLWEVASLLKGNFRVGLRRFRRSGTIATVEGSLFPTYYHSLSSIRTALGRDFELVAAEGLGALTPQPHHAGFPAQFPRLYALLLKADSAVRNSFPFNRWADHIIVTFRFKS